MDIFTILHNKKTMNSFEPIVDYRKLNQMARGLNTSVGLPIKVALLGNFSTQFLAKALQNQLTVKGLNSEIFEAPYRQIEVSILSDNSDLYDFTPEIIIIFESVFGIRDEFYSLDESDRINFAKHKTAKLKSLITVLNEKGLKVPVVYMSAELLDDQVFGSYSTQVESGIYWQLSKLNEELLKFGIENLNFHLFDINKYLLGCNQIRDWAQYYSSDLHYSLDASCLLANHLANYIGAINGRVHKCVVVDLDNTLWGGVVGDDGVQHIQISSSGLGKIYWDIQHWLKELKQRGVLLVVCSKNEESIAKEPFEKNRSMVLKISDFVLFVANWENKADNIRQIQQDLNIGMDSIVFIDDNPMERDLVKTNLKEVTVPELPPDPAEYLNYLQSLNLFETATWTKADKKRTTQYQQQNRRLKTLKEFTDLNSYLESLNMKARIAPFLIEDAERIAQLTQRSNQFNLTTIRYTKNDITMLIGSKQYLTYAVSLEDKFGDYGLVSIAILEQKSPNDYFIDSWIMSCRVLNRGVEEMLFNRILTDLIEKKAKYLSGTYIPTQKNKIVSKLLCNFGLIKTLGEKYSSSLTELSPKKSCLKPI